MYTPDQMIEQILEGKDVTDVVTDVVKMLGETKPTKVEELSIKKPKSATYARAVYNDKCLEEVNQMLKDGPKVIDLHRWRLTQGEWKEAVTAAKADLEFINSEESRAGSINRDETKWKGND